jgi:hypothetical protein
MSGRVGGRPVCEPSVPLSASLSGKDQSAAREDYDYSHIARDENVCLLITRRRDGADLRHFFGVVDRNEIKDEATNPKQDQHDPDDS